MVDYTMYFETMGKTKFPPVGTVVGAGIKGDMAYAGLDPSCLYYPLTFGYHANGLRVPAGILETGSTNSRPRGTRTM